MSLEAKLCHRLHAAVCTYNKLSIYTELAMYGQQCNNNNKNIYLHCFEVGTIREITGQRHCPRQTPVSHCLRRVDCGRVHTDVAVQRSFPCIVGCLMISQIRCYDIRLCKPWVLSISYNRYNETQYVPLVVCILRGTKKSYFGSFVLCEVLFSILAANRNKI